MQCKAKSNSMQSIEKLSIYFRIGTLLAGLTQRNGIIVT